MNPPIEQMIDAFTMGRINRRELIALMSGFVAAAATSGHAVAVEAPPTFSAVGLNHIALRVKDVAKSRDFYIKHLGMTVANESLPGNCFLNFEGGFLALFQGDEPRMDHYCYSVKDYSVQDAAAKLREQGIEPNIQGERIYFPDPDGLTVQLAADSHRP